MNSKVVLWIIIIAIFCLSSWQVYGIVNHKEVTFDAEVLSASSTKTIEERMASVESRVLTLERNAGLVKSKTTAKTQEQFKNLSGGTVAASDWSKISGTDFIFDASLYGSSVEVTWQGWIDNGNGSVRLYDSTNHRAVDYSEISTDSGVKSSFYSKPLSIWRGQNAYYVEGKNSGNDLTLSSPRLKIITK